MQQEHNFWKKISIASAVFEMLSVPIARSGSIAQGLPFTLCLMHFTWCLHCVGLTEPSIYMVFSAFYMVFTWCGAYFQTF